MNSTVRCAFRNANSIERGKKPLDCLDTANLELNYTHGFHAQPKR